VTIAVPRARLEREDGTTIEWKSKTLPAYRRRTKEVEALIAGSYLSGTNTRRVGRALASVFRRDGVSKDTVSRCRAQKSVLSGTSCGVLIDVMEAAKDRYCDDLCSLDASMRRKWHRRAVIQSNGVGASG
jgi:hypothetical protein